MSTSLSKRAADSSIRTFVAVEIPPEQKQVLAEIIERFTPERHALKLVNPVLLHITVRFLGAVASTRLPAVEMAVSRVSKQTDPFALTLSGIGAFPDDRAPRVLWVGIREDAGLRQLTTVAGQLEEALESEGFPRKSRAFSAHITLARTRNDIDMADRRRVADALRRVRMSAMPAETFEARELVVMRSDPGPSGPHYTPLLTAPFSGRGHVR